MHIEANVSSPSKFPTLKHFQSAAASQRVFENARPKEGERASEDDEVHSSAIIMQPSGMANQPPTTQIPTVHEATQAISQFQQQYDPEEVPAEDEPSTLPHVVVLYLVSHSRKMRGSTFQMNPFAFGSDCADSLWNKVVLQALVRSFNNLCRRLPMKRRVQLQLEVKLNESIDLVRFLDPEPEQNLRLRDDHRARVKGGQGILAHLRSR